jgi:hypothetical protein
MIVGLPVVLMVKVLKTSVAASMISVVPVKAFAKKTRFVSLLVGGAAGVEESDPHAVRKRTAITATANRGREAFFNFYSGMNVGKANYISRLWPPGATWADVMLVENA